MVYTFWADFVVYKLQSYDPSFGRKRKVADTFEVDTEEIRRVKLTDIESDYQLGCVDDTVIVEDGESLDGKYMYILDEWILAVIQLKSRTFSPRIPLVAIIWAVYIYFTSLAITVTNYFG